MTSMIQNAVYVPSHRRYYVSAHTHDFVSFEVNGESHFIDGGNDYRRVSLLSGNRYISDYCLTTAHSLNEIREKLLWGSYGKDGKKELVWKPIRNLSKRHLEAILRTQPVKGIRREVMEYWLDYKKLPQDIRKSNERWERAEKANARWLAKCEKKSRDLF